jgi:hypothetical protein
MTASLGLSAVAAVAIYVAYRADNGARCLSFMLLALFAIIGAANV